MQISIPNSTTGIDTEKLIQDLMDAERQPIVRTENRIQESQDTIAIWRTVSSNMKLFQDNAKKLYGINNPFSERIIENSHSNLVNAQPNRNAAIGKYSIIVKSISSPDKWLSKQIATDYQIPKGNYIFQVGDDEIQFNFTGNTINQLVTKINANANNIVKANLIQKGTKNTEQVMVLEGMKKGANNKIVLKELAEVLAKDIGMLGPNTKERPYIYLNTNFISSYLSDDKLLVDTTTSPNNDAVSTETTQHLLMYSGAIAKFQVPVAMYSSLLSDASATINFELYIRPTNVNSSQKNMSATTDPLAVKLDNTIVRGEQLYNFTTQQYTKEQEYTTTKEEDARNVNRSNITDNNKALGTLFNNLAKSIYEIKEKDITLNRPHKFSVPTSTLLEDNTLYFIMANPFPGYEIIIDTISLSDSSTSSEYVPLLAISNAQNATIEFEGIDIERKSNHVDDIIPGVTLNLIRADATQRIDLDVTSDHETIKNDIISYVGSYNQLTKNLLIYTRTERINSSAPQLLDVLTFTNATERTNAEQNLGKLSGEFSITTILNQLQTIVSTEYNNSIDPSISSLKTIGIESNLESNNSSIIANSFLDIDETKLDTSITENTEAIARLFASDNNNDIAIDYGVAFRSSESVQRFIEINGLIRQRQQTLNNKISRDKTELARYNDRLVRYEIELRRKYGNMEQIVNQLNRSSNALNNLNSNNNNNE